jgi:hypothetical protein
MFDRDETEVISKERECVSKDSEVVQPASGVASNAGAFKKPEVNFKKSQRVEEEPKFCLSEKERSTVDIPVDKTGVSVDRPVVFGGTETRINEGSLVLRRTEVVSKETEITFKQTDVPQKAEETPLIFKEVGKSTSEGLLIFLQTKIITNENKVSILFKRKKSDPVATTEAAVPLIEKHRTIMDSPVRCREAEEARKNATILTVDEKADIMDTPAVFIEPEESTRYTPVVFIDTERATVDSPASFAKKDKPSPRKVFPTGRAVSSRLAIACRKAFQEVSTMFSRAATVCRPHIVARRREPQAAEVSPCNRSDTCSFARRRSQSSGTVRMSVAMFRRFVIGAVCPCSV